MDESSKLKSDEEDLYLLLTDPSRRQEAVEPLFRLMGPLVRTVLRKKYTHMADDEIHEVLVAATYKTIRSADKYDARKGSLRAWFSMIVKRAAIDRWRASTRDERRELVRLAARDDPEFRTFESDVKRAVDKLSERQQVILLCDLETYPKRASAKLIAKMLTTTVGVVWTERSRAYEHLERTIGRRAPGGGR